MCLLSICNIDPCRRAPSGVAILNGKDVIGYLKASLISAFSLKSKPNACRSSFNAVKVLLIFFFFFNLVGSLIFRIWWKKSLVLSIKRYFVNSLYFSPPIIFASIKLLRLLTRFLPSSNESNLYYY